MRPPADVIAAARSFLGTPYRHRASRAGAGADCLGLVVGVFRDLTGEDPTLPPYGPDWRDNRYRLALEDLAESCLHPVAGPPGPGHVVLFHLGPSPLPRHCGILTDEGHFIHAQEGIGVVEVPLGPWASRIARAFSFP